MFNIIPIFSSFPQRLLSTAGCRGSIFISPLQKLQNCVPIGQRRLHCRGTYRWADRCRKSTDESKGLGRANKKRGRTVPRVKNTTCGFFGLMKKIFKNNKLGFWSKPDFLCFHKGLERTIFCKQCIFISSNSITKIWIL